MLIVLAPSTITVNHQSLVFEMAVQFPQQGSLDWISLGSQSGTLSIQLIQRISAAGIDGYTVLVGRAVCGTLVCGSGGRLRFLKALELCKGLAGYRSILWFGFGVKHIATALVSTEQGTTCAALCACLAECYSTNFAAEILMEMTREAKESDEMMPSLLQWHDLVRSCAGLVTRSTFGVHAEQMMRLAGDWRIANTNRRAAADFFVADRGVAHQTDIAKTLLGLGKLSRGLLFQMTIIGGADAGFIAAIADWLLDLRVEIRGSEVVNAKTDETLYRSKNLSVDQRPQLLVIYQKDAAKGSLHRVGQTYRLPDARQILRRGDGSTQELILSGRVPWEKAFEYTFNTDFKRLMGLVTAFGGAVGSAARIYQGLFEVDQTLPREWIRDCHSYFPDSYGPAYIHFILQRFHELEPLRDAMYQAASATTAIKACTNFEAHMKMIQLDCNCGVCFRADTDKEGEGERLPNFCLVYLAYTIINTSRALSGIVTEVLPMRAGLETMFWNLPKRYKILTAPTNIIEQDDNMWHTGSGTKLLLQVADTIFSGDGVWRLEGFKNWISAIAQNGLCYYFDILVNPTFGARRAARVHITPGSIEHHGRAYTLLRDSGPDIPPYSGSRGPGSYELIEVGDELERGRGGELEVLVEERLDGLSISYGVSRDKNICYSFGPARAVHSMCRNEGKVSTCYGKCDYSPQLKEIREAVRSCIKSGDTVCRIKEADTQTGLLFVLGDSWSSLDAATHTWDPIIQRVECLACCIRYALSTGFKHATIILGQHYVEALRRIETPPTAIKHDEETG